MKYANLEQRLLHRSVQLDNGCWMWMGRVEPNGYAKVTMRPKPKPALPVPFWVHRVAYETFKCEKIPEGFHVDHLCKFTLCVNPAHLEAVPVIDNVWHRQQKKRGARGRFV